MSVWRMHLAALLDGYAVIDDSPGPLISGISLDSRSIRHGDLFVALAGGSRHGLEFLDEALRRGCAAVAWEASAQAPTAGLGKRRPHAAIPHLSQCVGEIASRFYQHPSRDLTVIGVTGTNGKTSYVEFLGHALAEAGHRCGTIGTLGTGLVGDRRAATLTTPDAATLHRDLAAMRDAGAEYVAMEVSSHALDQGRVGGVAFGGAAFTNLSRDHLDYHGSMEAYLAAKARLFAGPGLKFAILNADDRHTSAIVPSVAENSRIITYGIDAGEIRGEAVVSSAHGLSWMLRVAGESFSIENQLIGRFNVYNLLAVAATLIALDWQPADVARGLAALTPPPGRMNVLGGARSPLVVIDYAHTPDALEKALQAVREHCAGELICVFGCGGDRDPGKRGQMGAIAESLADRVIVTDDNPRSEDGDRIVADILAGARGTLRVVRDRAQAIFEAVQGASADDVVLVAGKGHENYQEIAGRRRPFDDRQVAAQALGGGP